MSLFCWADRTAASVPMCVWRHCSYASWALNPSSVSVEKSAKPCHGGDGGGGAEGGGVGGGGDGGGGDGDGGDDGGGDGDGGEGGGGAGGGGDGGGGDGDGDGDGGGGDGGGGTDGGDGGDGGGAGGTRHFSATASSTSWNWDSLMPPASVSGSVWVAPHIM